MRSRALPRVLLAAFALTAGNLSPPGPAEAATGDRLRPAESIGPFVVALESAMKALHSGNCATVRHFARRANFAMPCNELGRARYAGFNVTEARQYGTGAVVRFTTTSTHFEGGGGAVAVALDESRRFSNVMTGYLRTDEFAAPSRRSLKLFDRTARRFVTSLRTKDCTLLFATGYTGPLARDDACRREFSPPSGRVNDLVRDPGAKPVRIGGSNQFQFYRLAADGHYRTLVVGRAGEARGARSLYLAGTERVF